MKRPSISTLFYPFICTLFFVHIAARQTAAQSAIDKFVKANSAIYQMSVNNSFRQGDAIYQFSFAAKSDVVGDPYIDANWAKSSVLLYDSSVLRGYLTRYDIRSDEIEFRLSEGIRTLKGSRVRSLLWVDSVKQTTRVLVNRKEFSSNEKQRAGFFEILADGKLVLLKSIVVEILRPDYNVALDVGSRDFRIIKKQKLYFSLDGELFEMKKKTLMVRLKDKSIDVTGFLKAQSINWSNEQDLRALFIHINKSE